MLHFDEPELIEFFGVVPTITNEFGLDYSFEYLSENHRLVFGFNVDTSDCSVCLYSDNLDRPLFQSVYLDTPGFRIVKDARGQFIEIGSPGSFSGRFDGKSPLHEGLQIWLEPTLSISTFRA